MKFCDMLWHSWDETEVTDGVPYLSVDVTLPGLTKTEMLWFRFRHCARCHVEEVCGIGPRGDGNWRPMFSSEQDRKLKPLMGAYERWRKGRKVK